MMPASILEHPLVARRVPRALALVAMLLLTASCENAVDPKPTSGELIRDVLVNGADESILFSSAVLANQTGTSAYARTIDSLHRGFVNRRFYDETVEVPQALAFESDVIDTIWGKLTFSVQGTVVTRSYNKLAYGGNAKLLDNACFTCSNPWRIWRMRQRKADQPNGQGDPTIVTMNVTGPAGTYPAAPSPQVRINRDSVVTVALDSVVNLSVRVETDAPDDTFFITYPVAGTYNTVAMSHNPVDSLGHTAVVGVRSSRRFELLAVQGFKRQALQDSLYNQAASSAIQTAIIAFR
jgi:hypothetical protein